MADYNEIYRAYREFKVLVDEILDDIFVEGYDNIEDRDERDRILQERFDEQSKGLWENCLKGLWENCLGDIVKIIALIASSEYGHEFKV